MKSYLPSAVLGIALTAAAIGFGAATAHASTYTNESAEQISFNGVTNVEPSQCMVTGVEGLTAGKTMGTAYTDVSCPRSNA